MGKTHPPMSQNHSLMSVEQQESRAPTPGTRPPDPADNGQNFGVPASGADQSGVRVYNERLVLSLARRFGPLSKVEVARMTGLSVQSASTIMNRLAAEGLLKREAPLRGRVGQPTVPVSLDPEGAFSLGLTIGRHACELVLVDFVGTIRDRARVDFRYPTPEATLGFLAEALPDLTGRLDSRQKARLAGLGVALPFQLWSWSDEIGAPAGAMDDWRSLAVGDEIERLSGLPVTVCNDATSACAAEFYFGEAWRERDFLYFFVGEFLGGGLVLNSSLFLGRRGNAAAVGSMPTPGPEGVTQLIHLASIYRLEQRVAEAGLDPSSIWLAPDAWGDLGESLDQWLDEAARALAYAIVSAVSVIDVGAAVIDGTMPAQVRERLSRMTAAELAKLDRRGLSDVRVLAGVIGPEARAIGGAALPLIKNFARDRDVLFKESAVEA
jgi:predicted NBD/HSP70 family sugar kinase